MLRRTSTALVFMGQQGPAKWCGHPTNDNIDELIIYVKNAKKLRQWYGSHFQRCPDREIMYMSMGGPRGGRFTIKRAFSKKQFYHHNYDHGKYAIHHTNPTNPWSGVGGGGQFHGFWDNQVMGTNAWWDLTFKMFGKDLTKDKAIEWMEDWGVKFKLLDEYSAPRMKDMLYVRHKLYAHNFPWIRDPIVNSHQGDPDHVWRGRDQFDYSQHGAATASVANEFRSLWGVKPAVPAATIQAAPASKKAANTTTRQDSGAVKPPKEDKPKAADSSSKKSSSSSDSKAETKKQKAAETKKEDSSAADKPKADKPKAESPKSSDKKE